MIAATLRITTFALALSAATLAMAGDAPVVSWDHPRWANPTVAFGGALTLAPTVDAAEVRVTAEYLDGEEQTVVAKPSEERATYTFSIPPIDPYGGMGGGDYLFYAQVQTASGDVVVSSRQTVPLSYAEELDITGNPPVVLPYPLIDESHLVRYIPCCNIFGGATMVERVPVNPKESDEGVPEQLLSDFVVLEPDGLSASTAGLYFRFGYDPESLPQGATPAVYTWEIDRWIEYYAYDVHADEAYVDFHCPDGGTFVLGLKN